MATIWQQAEELKDEMVERRRDLHRHPETGWTEFRTASMIIGELKKLGYDVKFGADVIDEKSMMGVPSEAELADYMQSPKPLFQRMNDRSIHLLWDGVRGTPFW